MSIPDFAPRLNPIAHNNGLIVLGMFSGEIPTATNKFSEGCILIKTDEVDGVSATFQNTGTSAVPSWSRLSISAGGGTDYVDVSGDTMTGALNISLATGNSLVVDTNTLVVDATNNRVGVGVASPTQALDVVGNIKIPRGNSYILHDSNVEIRNDNSPAWMAKGNTITFKTYDETADDGAWVFRGSFSSTNKLVILANSGYVGIGNITPTAKLDIDSDIVRLRTAKTPATAGATGNAGDICWDASYMYVCTATNTWRRIAHATW